MIRQIQVNFARELDTSVLFNRVIQTNCLTKAEIILNR